MPRGVAKAYAALIVRGTEVNAATVFDMQRDGLDPITVSYDSKPDLVLRLAECPGYWTL